MTIVNYDTPSFLFTNLCILVSISVKLEMTGRYFVVAGRYLIVAERYLIVAGR